MDIPSFVSVLLVGSFLLIVPSTSATVTNQSVSEDWNTSYSAGQFTHSAKPDQIFKIYYRVMNGTIEEINTRPLQIVAEVSSANPSGGVFEVRYPRNYPYSNDVGMSGGVDNFVIYEQQPGETDLQIAGNGTTTDCFFIISVPFTGQPRISIYSAYIPEEFVFQGDTVPASCLPDTTVSNVSVRNDGSITPRQQFKAGVAAEDIVCREGLELIIQPISGKPYCAPSDTKQKLIRWWNLQDPIN